ncbi:Tat pathway signal sequence domain protein [Streptomyces sp. NPDC054784]
MRIRLRRHLGKVVAGSAIAVTCTAMMVAVTLPGGASGDDGNGGGGGTGQDGGTASAEQHPATVEEAPEEGEKGTGRDPLTEDERERAAKLALDRGLRERGEGVEGDKGAQPLTTDLVEPEPSEVGRADAPRRADVSYYDYADDTYVTRTVNLDTGKVEHDGAQHGVQPPPTRPEAREAAALLLESPRGAELKRDYEHAMGKPLTSAGQLDVTGYVYRVDTENAGADGMRECGKHRCVRLFTRADGGPWIDTRRFVVDLSARTVGRLG